MSATATDNASSPLHDYLVTGETLFVTAAVLAFVSDIALTFRSLVALNWIGLTLGTLFILGTLYFINWLYTGAKEARAPATIWAGLQILIAVTGVYLLLNKTFGWDYHLYKIGAWLPQALSVPSDLLGIFKAAAYGMFVYSITQRGPALFYLRHKGGEAVEVPSPTTPPEDVHPTGTVLPLTADQTQKANGLASTLQMAGFALMTAGFFGALVGGQRIATAPRFGWLALGEGIVLLVLGVIALAPVASVRNIKERGTDTAYIGDALAKLGGMVSKLVLLALALAALGVGGLILRLVKG
ncbi:MAG: hypothetical protein WCL32_02110 [Planctomycetota bacterium]